MLKICFKALPELSFVKIVFLVTIKMMSLNKRILVIFRAEIVLKTVVLAKYFTLQGINQYLRHITRQYCHIRTFIGLVLMGNH